MAKMTIVFILLTVALGGDTCENGAGGCQAENGGAAKNVQLVQRRATGKRNAAVSEEATPKYEMLSPGFCCEGSNNGVCNGGGPALRVYNGAGDNPSGAAGCAQGCYDQVTALAGDWDTFGPADGFSVSNGRCYCVRRSKCTILRTIGGYHYDNYHTYSFEASSASTFVLSIPGAYCENVGAAQLSMPSKEDCYAWALQEVKCYPLSQISFREDNGYCNCPKGTCSAEHDHRESVRAVLGVWNVPTTTTTTEASAASGSNDANGGGAAQASAASGSNDANGCGAAQAGPTYQHVGTGLCNDPVGIRTYDGSADNGGSNDARLASCANSCFGQTTEKANGPWSRRGAALGFSMKPSGKCYCNHVSYSTCKKSHHSYETYEYQGGDGTEASVVWLNPPELARSYSSVFLSLGKPCCGVAGVEYGMSRLDTSAGKTAWSAGAPYPTPAGTTGEWMMIDTGVQAVIAGVITQGRATSNQWVTSYRVQCSTDGISWADVDGGATFTGNSDRSTRVERFFDSPVTARFVKIYPLGWEVMISMRAGLLVQQACAASGSNDANGGGAGAGGAGAARDFHMVAAFQYCNGMFNVGKGLTLDACADVVRGDKTCGLYFSITTSGNYAGTCNCQPVSSQCTERTTQGDFSIFTFDQACTSFEAAESFMPYGDTQFTPADQCPAGRCEWIDGACQATTTPTTMTTATTPITARYWKMQITKNYGQSGTGFGDGQWDVIDNGDCVELPQQASWVPNEAYCSSSKGTTMGCVWTAKPGGYATWYTGHEKCDVSIQRGGCGPECCPDVWVIYDLGKPVVPCTFKFKNYGREYGVQEFKLYAGAEKFGPWKEVGTYNAEKMEFEGITSDLSKYPWSTAQIFEAKTA